MQVRDAKASSAGSTSGQGSRLGSVRRAFATRGASHDATGSGAHLLARKRGLAFSASGLLALLSALVLLSATASADTRFGEEGSASGQFTSPGGIAVSKAEGGSIYLTDAGNNQRVNEFTSAGAWVRAFGWGIVPGATTATGSTTNGTNALTSVVTTSGQFLAGQIVEGAGIPPNTRVSSISGSEVKLSQTATATASNVALTVTAGPGNISTNEIQQLTVRATGGEFTLAFKNPNPGSTTVTTPPLTYNSSAAAVQAALEALTNVGSGNVSVTGGPGDETGSTAYLVEFTNRFVDTNVNQLTTTNVSLTGGSPSSSASVTTTREGAGALETCTTVCWQEAGLQGFFERGQGSEPGQIRYSNKIAVDNNSASGSYGDVYVVDQRNLRVEKYSASGQFLLMFGGEVNKTTHADICTAADLAGGDRCGAGVAGTAGGRFFSEGSKNWTTDSNSSIAVGPGGTVYVGDYQRVQKFSPSGAFEGELSIPDERFITALAVDASGNLYERSATYQGFSAVPVSQFTGIRKYDAAGTLVGTFDTTAGSEPVYIGLDASNDLIVADRNSGSFEFRAFKPNSTLYAAFSSDQAPNLPTGIAVDPEANTIYAPTGALGNHVAVIPLPVPGPSVISEEHVTDIQPTTATLRALVNPKGYDTEYHFEYVDQESFQSEGGFASPHTQSTTSIDLGLVDHQNAVNASISGLEPATVYHYRAVGESSQGVSNGADSTFETLPPVSVRSFTTQTVGPNLIELKAELNPNGSGGTYKIQIGEDTSYSTDSSEDVLAVSNEFSPVSAIFTGLTPNTTYHYQLIAENGYGRTETVDQTVTTELSATEEREAESCPNTNLREENNSLALADCRAYEQVSPVYKDGFATFPQVELSPSGNAGLFASSGAFSGAVHNELFIQYIASRSESGWTTRAAVGAPAGPGYMPQIAESFTAELDRSLFKELPGLALETARGEITSGAYYMGKADGAFSKATPTMEVLSGAQRSNCCFMGVRGQADDLSRLYIHTGNRFLVSDPRPDDFESSDNTRIYEVSGADTATPEVTLAAEVPLGLTSNTCHIDEPLGRQGRLASADGITMVYTSPIEVLPGGSCGSGSPNPIGLFVRTGDTPAVRLNTPPSAQCAGSSPCASGAAATPFLDSISPDGERVWFTTSQPLIDSDTDATSDVYLAKLDGGQLDELVQVSNGDETDPTPGAGAAVQGVLGTSGDGTHISFAATGVLTTHPNGLGEAAAQNAMNIYVFDANTGDVHFITRGCSGPEKSGTVVDGACPANLSTAIGFGAENDSPLWKTGSAVGSNVSHLTSDGEFLLFPSYGRLGQDDTDTVQDLYRYSVADGSLVRVSIGNHGNDGNGNDDEFSAQTGYAGGSDPRGIGDDLGRSISDDGSIAIFLTKAPLVSRDTNDAVDVYQWEEAGRGLCDVSAGCVSLVSSGVDSHDVFNAVVSRSGRDISFATPRDMIPADIDGVWDMYDARVDGGFRTPVAPSPCGSPDVCRGSTQSEPVPPNIVTEQFVGPGNAESHLKCGKGRRRVIRHGQPRCVKKHQKKAKKKHQKKSKNKRRQKAFNHLAAAADRGGLK